MEQSRADIAAANLRAIWIAQRLFWLEYRSYSEDLSELETLDLIDPSLISNAEPYACQIDYADATTFIASAIRTGSERWSGELTINQDGVLQGQILDGETIIEPGFL